MNDIGNGINEIPIIKIKDIAIVPAFPSTVMEISSLSS
jgi:hypothetical protein